MTDKEILINIKLKSYKNSFYSWDEIYLCINDNMAVLYNEEHDLKRFVNLYEFIFDHDFAKAFWGECNNPDFGPLCITHDCDIRSCITWEDHLKEMVLKKEPLKYLEKFL